MNIKILNIQRYQKAMLFKIFLNKFAKIKVKNNNNNNKITETTFT